MVCLCSDVVISQLVYFVSEIDVMELYEIKEWVQYLVSYDLFIGLLNCIYLMECLFKVFVIVVRKCQIVMFYLVDLDDFKLINDIQGYVVGDVLLQLVVNKLKEFVGLDDIVVWFGGDEFLICYLEDLNVEGFGWFGKFLLGIFGYYQMVDGWLCNIFLSIGYMYYLDDGRLIDDLMCNVDLVFYQVKLEIKNKCVKYNVIMCKCCDESLVLKKDFE